MYVSMSPEIDVSFSSAAICSSACFRSRRTLCAASWLFQKLGSATRASRAFRRSRYCGASKITPHERGALLEPFVAMLEIFEDHAFSGKSPAGNGRHFAFRKVAATRITETSTQSEAKQSPKRV